MTSPRTVDGPSTPTVQGQSPQNGAARRRRRLSVEEDYFYEQVMTTSPRRPPAEPPPPYRPFAGRRTLSRAVPKRRSDDVLPPYSTDIDLQGVWETKMEIEDTNKRADSRQWSTVLIELRGTQIKLYSVKNDWAQWGWGVTKDWVTAMSPDNPPWVRKGALLRAYTLQHADAGIAADYKKRRNVIRLRLETDQLLIACVESTTFVKWLDALFAAMAIAEPLEEREFPPDQSIPRTHRSRWLRTSSSLPGRHYYPIPTPRPLSQLRLTPPNGGNDSRAASRDYSPNQASSMSLALNVDPETNSSPAPESQNPGQNPKPVLPFPFPSPTSSPTLTPSSAVASRHGRMPADRPSTRRSAASASTYRHHATASVTDLCRPWHASTVAPTGKWTPHHGIWTVEDDIRYARLCFSVLLYQSPRKSEYVVLRGTRWFVDWETGRMIRVLPPRYGQFDNDRPARRLLHY
ncbi:hypothetical protein SODALDRAFT_164338 [Sodiomyces alkalinus F11]|uniref:Pleckstrin homology domain-containing protein n=1 Tax=Sodiomyces alkalinus (strain CBS 110278 / VKM F-3762 / F11) TaxID=1314773 RepID=A0A3N2PVK8_SODAK|nr:hypothetical protein SODALDRAFT_164338 [Sodiomyces alkalinus F11]ROT38529.1 hypothetical protein SODALDRAFT_164338 [Sodiomyces alkalinus F11]